jgi:Flp pilus assembly protein TadG
MTGSRILENARGLLRRALKDRRGVHALEFAILATPLLMMMGGAIEVGRVLFIQSALHYSVQEAARCASSSTSCGTTSQTTAFAAARSGAGIPASAFTAASSACGNLVTANYPVQLFIPMMSLTVTLTARSCFPS